MPPEDWRGDAAALLEYESIYQEAIESAEELDSIDQAIDLDFKRQHAPKLRDLVSFYIWSHLMIMSTVRLLIERELIDEQYNQQAVREHLRDSHTSDKILLDMVKEGGVIDRSLHSKLNRVRRIRNEMAHSIQSRALLHSDELDTDSLETEVERAHRAYEEIQEQLS